MRGIALVLGRSFQVFRLAPSDRPIPSHSHFRIWDSPARAIGIHENNPKKGTLRTVVDDEMGPTRPFGRFKGKWRVKLLDHEKDLQLQ